MHVAREALVEAVPMGQTYGQGESDISELSLATSGLRVVVNTNLFQQELTLVELLFPTPRGFRYLDESAVLRYLHSPKISTQHHLYRVASGGWLETELVDEPSLQGLHEFFVRTTNGCLNVLSFDVPLVRVLM